MPLSKKTIFFAFIWHGIFLAITSSMLDLNTVFPSLVNTLTENTFVFASLLTVMLGTPLIFNLLFSHFLRRAKRKRNFLLLGIYLRAFSFLSIGIFVYFFAENNPWITIMSLYFFLLMFSISAGFAGISYSDLIGKTLPDTKDRTKLFTYIQFFSSIAAFLGGLIITYIFTKDLNYPINYSLSLIIGFVGLLIASIGYFFVKEPAETNVNESSESFVDYLKKIPKIIKNDFEFRKYIIIDNFSSFGVMIIPFYIVFARNEMSIDDSYIGIYLLIILFGKLMSTFFWGYVGKRWNAKTIVTVCITVGGIVPIIAIALSNFSPIIFGIVFFFVGFIISGRKIGFSPYLLDIAPKERRIEYLGIRGSLNVFMIILPLLAALVINLFGYIYTFIMVSVIMLLTSLFHIYYQKKTT